ncbi:MAG: hypothetical protein PBV86_12400 [Delftia lacustris]|uniref:hypothetical protein n=1 Tax=Delftia TaxID=80865 RepID=UPI00259CFE97|nr:hypothetical protein [Delftia sp.]
MKLNCNPGDRAVVENSGTSGDGHTLTVLYRAPVEGFYLPDGQRAIGAGHEEPKWVVQLDRPTNVVLYGAQGSSRRRAAVYGVARDAILRSLGQAKAVTA